MTCSKCVAILHEADKFCDSCGKVTAVFEKSRKVRSFLCLHCGTPLKRTKHYCTACGDAAAQKHRAGLFRRVRHWVNSPKAQLALALGLFFLLVTPVLYLMKWGIHFIQVTPTSCGWAHGASASQSATIDRYGVGSTATACCTRR